MAEEDLSWEERNHLYSLSLIPMMAVFFVILVYFNYLMYMNSLRSRLAFILEIGLPFLILMPTAFMVTFEVLYHRRIKKALGFHLKRLTGRMIFNLISVLWFVGLMIELEPILSPVIGDRDFIISNLIAVITYGLIVLRFRKFVGKLTEGYW